MMLKDQLVKNCEHIRPKHSNPSQQESHWQKKHKNSLVALKNRQTKQKKMMMNL